MIKNVLLSISVMIIAVSAIAQKDYSKKVQSKYISLPSYNVSEIDPASVIIEFAMNSAEFGTEKLKDAESTCIPSEGTLKDAVKITSFYFEIPYTQQESYIVAKSTDGTIVYADKSSNTRNVILKFGWSSKMNQPFCKYYKVDKLKNDFKSTGSSFKVKENSEYQNRVYKEALTKAKVSVYLSYFPDEFKVYSAKGGEYDYTNLNEAFDKAMSVYKSINKNGLHSNDVAQLKEAIVVWEKELESIDLENKKGRINKSIGKGLHQNCVKAALYTFDFENAKSHAKAFLKLYGNFSDNRSLAMGDLLISIQAQSMAAQTNAAILDDIENLNTMATAASKKMNGELLSSIEFTRLLTEYTEFVINTKLEVREQYKEDKASAIASGALNPYQQFYSAIAAGGPAMLMNLAPSILSGIPVLKEVPKEILEFKDLSQLIILNNSIETITPDIIQLTLLKKLDLSGNELKTIPAEIGQLANLKTLKLSNNPLVLIPVEIANCKNLTSLIIKGTNLSDDAIAELVRLLPECKIKY